MKAKVPEQKPTELPVLFGDIEDMLIKYKNASPTDRQFMLARAMATVDSIPDDIKSKKDATKAVTELAYADCLLRYAETLHNMENQGFFGILVDYYKMDLGDTLKDYFEFGPGLTMRLKKPISEYTQNVWEAFRLLQEEHLRKHGKEKNFNLRQLEVGNPPGKQIYPIQIQMLGLLDNKAVDIGRINPQTGEIRYVENSFGDILSPGGGMKEITSAETANDYLDKVLDEYLEEQQGDLAEHSAALYDKIDKTEFNNTLTHAFDEAIVKYKKANDTWKAKNSDTDSPEILDIIKTLENLKDVIDSNNDNSKNINEVILAIDTAEKTIEEKYTGKDNPELQKLLALRVLSAELQVNTFKKTPMYLEARKFLDENSKRVIIRQYNDSRAVGGSQKSQTFIMRKSLTEWFEKKGFKEKPGDDLKKAKFVKMNFFKGIATNKVKYSHNLIAAAVTIDALQHNELDYKLIGKKEDIIAAKDTLRKNAQKMFDLNCDLVLGKRQPVANLDAEVTTANLATGDKKDLKNAISAFNLLVEKEVDSIKKQSTKDKTLFKRGYEASIGRIIEGYKNLNDRCEVILKSKNEKLWKKILITAAVVAVDMVAVAVAVAAGAAAGATAGAAAGLWSGPGALFTALMGAVLGAGAGLLFGAGSIAKRQFTTRSEPIQIDSSLAVEMAEYNYQYTGEKATKSIKGELEAVLKEDYKETPSASSSSSL